MKEELVDVFNVMIFVRLVACKYAYNAALPDLNIYIVKAELPIGEMYKVFDSIRLL
jgi:hypothetical protein